MPGIARVSIDSPLPQLDRLFDYAIPDTIRDSIRVGVRVKVPFGRGKSLYDGFVIALEQTSEFEGKLAEITQLVSTAPVLTPEVYQLVRSVADRQASTASDVLRLAVPPRSVAVEKRWLAENQNQVSGVSKKHDVERDRTSVLVAPVTGPEWPAWVSMAVEKSVQEVSNGQSVIICVPDYRDQKVLLSALENSPAAGFLVDYSSDQKTSAKYKAFLDCLGKSPTLVVGSRSAIYAPVQNLGLILVWDDGDSSHIEPSSPYSHTREVALIRQKQSGCGLIFAGHVRSTEIQRLVEIGYLNAESFEQDIPNISAVDREVRVDGVAWSTIRDALKFGSVLVQVAARGTAVSSYCSGCSERAACNQCNGPIWVDGAGQVRCRWCNQTNLNFRCRTCGANKLRTGTAGSSRTAADFGRAFPGVQIIESNGDHRIELIESDRAIVVSTPGAEPRVLGGYSAVVILDANQALNRDSLRASEDAFRQWANAIALANAGGTCLVVGIRGELARCLTAWAPGEFAHGELQSRRELRFPPAVRLASVSAEAELLEQVLSDLRSSPGIEVLGPMPVYEKNLVITWRAFLKYDYSQGEWLAKHLRAATLVHSSGQSAFSAKSGRAVRPIRVKMDDSEVI